MNTAAKKAKGRPPNPFAGIEGRARRECRRRRLHLIVEGPAKSPRWGFYSGTSGGLLTYFWPATRKWLDPGRAGGTARDWRHAVRLAVERDRSGQQWQLRAVAAGTAGGE
jgi:hypothetical protein